MGKEISYYSSPYMELVYYDQTSKSYPIHTHTNHYTFGFQINGSIAIHNNGIDTVCNAGEYFFVAPNTAHSFTSIDHCYYTMVSICIESEYILTTDFTGILVTLRELMDKVDHYQKDILWNRVEIEEALQVFYVGIIGITYRKSGFTEELKKIIMHSFDDCLSIDKMSKSVCVSPYHMIRKFKKELGLTPHQFQLQARIRKAQMMLKSGESVIKVAYLTGFCDQSHFDRCFHKIVGLSPTEYKESIR